VENVLTFESYGFLTYFKIRETNRANVFNIG